MVNHPPDSVAKRRRSFAGGGTLWLYGIVDDPAPAGLCRFFFGVSVGLRTWLYSSSWLMALAFMLSVNCVVIAQVDDEDAAAKAAERRSPLTEQQFDQLVFKYQRWVSVMEGVKRLVEPERPSADDFRNYMEDVLATEIRAIDLRVSLTDSQTKKLSLAGRGDILQYIRRADDLRPKLTLMSLEQRHFDELTQELWLLHWTQRVGIYGERSIFRKTLRRTLVDEQCPRYRLLERERQQQIIEGALLKCEQSNDEFSLAGETRKQFLNLLLDHGRVPQQTDFYGQQIVLLEANLLCDRVKPLLSESEWRKFELQVAQAKRFEPTLERYGLWSARRSQADEDEVDTKMRDGQ